MENIKNSDIKSLLMNNLSLEEIYVSSNGKHFKIIAVGKIFNKLTQIKRQKIIYNYLMKYITNNFIHAITIKTYTPEEWVHNQKLHVI